MANSLNNQGVRTPPKGGVGGSVHTFRRGLFVKFRKSPHRTEKALRHAQKPATPRSANPIGPESTYVVPGKDPPMATPPKGRKMAPERPFPALLRLAKVTQKRGFCRGFCRRFCRRFSGRFSGGFPTVFRQFSGGFPARQFSGPTVFRRFAGGALSLKQPRSDSGPSPSSERNYRQFRTHFQAYKPSIAAFSKVCL